MRRVCPKCGTEAREREMICANCMESLPSVLHLQNLMRMAIQDLDRQSWRTALNHLTEFTRHNPGSPEAWVLLALCQIHYRMVKEAKASLTRAGIPFGVRICPVCHGSKRCPDCNGSGVCVMCRGKRRCHMCMGKGACPNCGGVGCPVCRGTGRCVRCGGSGHCSFCGGSGACSVCEGSGACPRCGGEGKAIDIDLSRVTPTIRQYLEKYGHFTDEPQARRGIDPFEEIDFIGRR